MLIQHAATAGAHPLSGTVADYVWLLPILPLLGFIANGLLSLVASVKFGPDDPSADHNAGSHDAHAGEHGAAVAHGDDHHPVARHPYAFLASLIGPGVLVLTFGLALAMFAAMRGAGGGEMHAAFIQRYFSWMPVGDLQIDVAFQLDQLSMLMVLIISGVGALIHVFSVGYMVDDPGYPRYFAYLNLFVFFMLVLVLGASYPIMFIGWEGVGLCSYLLIGYWFSEKANADAGKKAFIVNRIGDFGFLVAMFMLFANIGALDFAGVNAGAAQLGVGGAVVTAICLFLFLGCAGKSAQIPLYIWLPDAMAGPTPVSALIHAATMVTAGVYLIARSNVLFALAPVASLTVVVVGALTAVFAASIGLKQWDIKKVLAYSTVSQLGYMFMGVGSGAYVAGVFHLMTHAFFKALLFLGSGSVIYAMHAAYYHTGKHDDAQDMRNMGGLKKFMPITWVLMWIATLAISGIPPFAGFFSKDEILAAVHNHGRHGTALDSVTFLGLPGGMIMLFCYVLGLAAAFMTAIYMTRMMLYTFHGPNRTGDKERDHLHEAPWVMTGPLVVLGVLSAVGGWFNLPSFFPAGPGAVLEHWLEPVVGASTARLTGGATTEVAHSTELILVGIAILVAVGGIALAFARLKPDALVPKNDALPEQGFERVLANKYYVDEAYDAAIVNPIVATSRGLLWRGIDVGLIDGLTRLIVQGKDDDNTPGAVPMGGLLTRSIGWVGSQLQSGQVGTYAWVLVVGVLFVLGAFTFR